YQLVNVLTKGYKISAATAQKVVFNYIDVIKKGGAKDSIMKQLYSKYGMPSVNMISTIDHSVGALYNSTRLWTLKGHTVMETFGREVDPLELEQKKDN